jgi:hypothetical protein
MNVRLKLLFVFEYQKKTVNLVSAIVHVMLFLALTL